jgi:hypothetical protein
METGYREGNGREESTGRRLDGQRTVENFGNRKALKDVTNRVMIIRREHKRHRQAGDLTSLL